MDIVLLDIYMGKAPQGIMGPFFGKVGTVIGYDLNGQHIMRGLAQKSFVAPTDLVLNNRGKLTLINKFIKKMRGFIKMAFVPEARGTTKNWHNLVIQYNNPHAIKGVYPDLEIDYPKVVLSRGELAQPANAVVEIVKEGIKFSWDVNDDNKNNDDQAMMMLYFPEDSSAKFETGGAKRKTGSDVIKIDKEDLVGKTIETFISFTSNDRLQFSNSLYTGRFEPEAAETLGSKALNGATAKIPDPKPEISTQQATRNKLQDVAYNLKTLDLDIADIAFATGLSEEEIKAL